MGTKSVKTIEDIARLANVSKSTVSRALNDSSLINKDTRERIQAIAKEHDFCINTPARCLSMRQSNTIAFVMHKHYNFFAVEDLFGMEILGSIATSLHALGYDLLIVHDSPHNINWAHQYLDSNRVDGFVLMTSIHRKVDFKALVEMEAPFIVWGDPLAGLNYCSVNGDNIAGGRIATEHLIRTGKQQIGFLGGMFDEIEVKNRYKGYEAALIASGKSVDQKRVVYGDYSFKSGGTAMTRLMDQCPDLDAVFVNSDLMAISAIEAILNRGKRVPEDIAVVGYDDSSIAAYNNLPLTTIRQNIPMAGKLLAQNLVEYIKTGVVTNVTIPVELVTRKSA